MNARRLLTLIAATVGLTIASSASAFVLLFNWADNPEKWDVNNVRWTWSGQAPTGVTTQEVATAITNSFGAWQAVGCATITFTAGGVRATDPGSGIHIAFQKTNWDPTVADALAFSSSETYENGTIASNDIMFNAVDVTWTSSFPTANGKNDIQSVAIHEIGHSLGLDHTREFTAIMFFTETNAHGRQLHADDQRGLCMIYPRSAFTSGQVCDSCVENNNCASKACFDFGGSRAFCGANCGAGNACAEGFTCYQIQGVTAPQCLPNSDHCDVSGRNLPLGSPCYGHDVCTSGVCLVTDDDAYCSKQCQRDSDCGGEFACLQNLCFATGGGSYGDLCESSVDCSSLVCASFTPLRARCTVACGAGQPACPSGDRCLPSGVCAPAGNGVLGALCAGTDDCTKGYCESGACTQPCGTGCPRGSTCEGGFCRGAAIGTSCGGLAGCPGDLTCVASGTCQRICNPLTETGCATDERCVWRAGAGATVEGRCEPSNGGGDLYASCGAAKPCDVQLLCDDTPTTALACRRDCRLSDGFGCEFFEDCVAIDDPHSIPAGDIDARRGICLQPPDEIPDAGPTDTNVGTPDQGPGVDAGTPPDSGGGTPPAGDGGCGGGRHETALSLSMGLALLGWRRRVRRGVAGA